MGQKSLLINNAQMSNTYIHMESVRTYKKFSARKNRFKCILTLVVNRGTHSS